MELTALVRNRSRHLSPKITRTLRRLIIANETEAQITRIQHISQHISTAASRFWPVDRGRYIEHLGIRIRIPASRVGDEVGLICLCEGAETGDDGERRTVPEGCQVNVEVGECGQEICSVEAGRD